MNFGGKGVDGINGKNERKIYTLLCICLFVQKVYMESLQNLNKTLGFLCKRNR